MKKYLAVFLSVIIMLNLTACSFEKKETVSETNGMLTQAEIETIFGALHRTGEEEDAQASSMEMKAGQNRNNEVNSKDAEAAEEAETEETEQVLVDGVPAEYMHLFGNGDFDENLVWTGYDEEYSELIDALYAFCEENVMGSVLLANDEDILFTGGFNAKEIDEETTVNPFTTYEIGALTQSFTAAAIIQQMQEGNLKGSDTLDMFFPDYPHGAGISVDNLLHMDSGIPDYINESMKFFAGRTAEEYDAFMNGEMEDEVILEYLNKSEPVFEAGKKVKDSNTNYYLLALILEQVTGLAYEDYVQAYLLDWCKMTHTTCIESGNLTSVPSGNGSYLSMGRVGRGALDMHSNVCDILIWDRELMSGNVLGEEYLEYMLEPRNGYACGWFEAGEGSYGQWGSTDGYLCVNYIYRLDEETLYCIMMIPDRTKWALPGKTMDVLESYLK